MIRHSSKLPNLATTIFTTMGQLARKHKAVDISQGYPNFAADPYLLRLVNNALSEGHNQYAPMQGVYSLREVIAKKMEALYGQSYDPEHEITVTAGATQAIFTAIAAFVGPGDEVIVLEPAFDCYAPAIALVGATMVPMPMENDFSIDWNLFRSKLSSRTKMVIINSPHNPSGSLFAKNDMVQLQEALQNTDAILLSDEVYEHIIFDGQAHESAYKYPQLVPRTLVCASFGKTFHVTGWKVGYMAGARALMEEFNKVHQYNVFCVNHPMQQALAQYLKQPEHYTGLAAFYQEKRDYFLNSIRNSKFKYAPSKGTYFQVLDFSDISAEKDVDFCVRLVKEHQIATIPLSVFRMDGADHKQVRCCFAKTQETLDRAAEILNGLGA